jgi:hypothetical protein
VLTVVSDSANRDNTTDPATSTSSLIDEIVREGARRMLAEALRAEVDAYIARFADERGQSGHRLVVRNGYHAARDVLTSAGSVEVVAPKVNDMTVASINMRWPAPRFTCWLGHHRMVVLIPRW